MELLEGSRKTWRLLVEQMKILLWKHSQTAPSVVVELVDPVCAWQKAAKAQVTA